MSTPRDRFLHQEEQRPTSSMSDASFDRREPLRGFRYSYSQPQNMRLSAYQLRLLSTYQPIFNTWTYLTSIGVQENITTCLQTYVEVYTHYNVVTLPPGNT